VPRNSAGRLSIVVSPPRLHAKRVPAHHDEIREPAAALGAAELQILHRHIAATAVDDRLQVRRASPVASVAPDEQAQPIIVRSMVRAVGRLSDRSLSYDFGSQAPSGAFTERLGAFSAPTPVNATMIPDQEHDPKRHDHYKEHLASLRQRSPTANLAEHFHDHIGASLALLVRDVVEQVREHGRLPLRLDDGALVGPDQPRPPRRAGSPDPSFASSPALV
jgi:hypothetical protein